MFAPCSLPAAVGLTGSLCSPFTPSMASLECTQSDAQRLEPISKTESETEDERADAKAPPVKHKSPTAEEERSWSPDMTDYTRCLVHESITRLGELKDRWDSELGIFTEMERDDSS